MEDNSKGKIRYNIGGALGFHHSVTEDELPAYQRRQKQLERDGKLLDYIENHKFGTLEEDLKDPVFAAIYNDLLTSSTSSSDTEKK